MCNNIPRSNENDFSKFLPQSNGASLFLTPVNESEL